jgi:hypothetical protein
MKIGAPRPLAAALGFATLGLGLSLLATRPLAARAAEGAPAKPAAAPAAQPAGEEAQPDEGEAPKQGTPVRWDQKRVTEYAVELAEAVKALAEEVRKQPIQTPYAKRLAQRDLAEDMRLIENSTVYLAEKLKGGAGRDETEATFRRTELLRRNAAEHARRSDLPDNLMKALVHAGEIHNRMKPYYYGKR